MSIVKQFSKTKKVCKATFSLPKESVVAVKAKEVVLVGDFNSWNMQAPIAMKKQKDGSFKATVELENGKEFQFRYVVNKETWMNDTAADKYVSTPFGVENSVVVTLN